MNNFIKNLQQKPEKERRKILYLITAVVTLLILVIWVVSFHNEFGSKPSTTVETNPLTILKNNLGNAYQGFSAGLASSSLENSPQNQ